MRRESRPKPAAEAGLKLRPRSGVTVTHGRHGGMWRVWAQAPDACWWLVPDDDTARAIMADAMELEIHTAQGCAQIPTREIRSIHTQPTEPKK
jgi:hypothetical protein